MSGSSNQNYENRRIARGKRNLEANNRENSEQNWGISCCSNSDRFSDNRAPGTREDEEHKGSPSILSKP